MQVALLLTGYYRSFSTVYPSIQNIIDRYQAQVFISTWNQNSHRQNKQHHLENITRDSFLQVHNLRGLDVCDVDVYQRQRQAWVQNQRNDDVMVTDQRAREHGSFWANRLRDQWYLVQRGWDMIQRSGQNFDVVFRSRMDIELQHVEFMTLQENAIYIPQDIGGWNYTDHMAYGSAKVMHKYCTFYRNMQSVYDDYNIDPTHAVEFPRFYMQQIPPNNRIVIDCKLRYRIV